MKAGIVSQSSQDLQPLQGCLVHCQAQKLLTTSLDVGVTCRLWLFPDWIENLGCWVWREELSAGVTNFSAFHANPLYPRLSGRTLCILGSSQWQNLNCDTCLVCCDTLHMESVYFSHIVSENLKQSWGLTFILGG